MKPTRVKKYYYFEMYFQLQRDIEFRKAFLFCGTDMIQLLFNMTPEEFVLHYRADYNKYWAYYINELRTPDKQSRFIDYCIKRRRQILGI